MSGGVCDAVCGDGICSGTDTCTVSSPPFGEDRYSMMFVATPKHKLWTQGGCVRCLHELNHYRTFARSHGRLSRANAVRRRDWHRSVHRYSRPDGRVQNLPRRPPSHPAYIVCVRPTSRIVLATAESVPPPLETAFAPTRSKTRLLETAPEPPSPTSLPLTGELFNTGTLAPSRHLGDMRMLILLQFPHFLRRRGKICGLIYPTVHVADARLCCVDRRNPSGLLCRINASC